MSLIGRNSGYRRFHIRSGIGIVEFIDRTGRRFHVIEQDGYVTLAALADGPVRIMIGTVKGDVKVLIEPGEQVISYLETNDADSGWADTDGAISAVEHFKIPIV